MFVHVHFVVSDLDKPRKPCMSAESKHLIWECRECQYNSYVGKASPLRDMGVYGCITRGHGKMKDFLRGLVKNGWDGKCY